MVHPNERVFRHASVIVISLSIGFCAAESIATAGPQPSRATLMSAADHLYSEAQAIVLRTPHTNMEAATLTGSAGRTFYAHDRALQIALGQIQSRDPILIDLSSIEQWSYHAVAGALASCNAAAARENLRVAHAFLEEAHRELAGTARDDWAPPDVNPNESNRCQK
jgi:hypothetical protein